MRLAAYIFLAYSGMSLICLLTYWSDKNAARKGTWRVSEQTLHLLGFLCGWPGGLAAQKILRHKTRKVSFLRQFWMTVVLNVVVLSIGIWFTVAVIGINLD